MVRYPVLIGEMAKRKIPKKEVAKRIGVCYKTLCNKMEGKSPFSWPEVCTINKEFFPDIEKDTLFSCLSDGQP